MYLKPHLIQWYNDMKKEIKYWEERNKTNFVCCKRDYQCRKYKRTNKNTREHYNRCLHQRYKVNISQSLSHVLAMSNGIWKKKDIHMTLFSKRNIWLKIWQNMYDINTRGTTNFDLKNSK